jgi:hypothetical protein
VLRRLTGRRGTVAVLVLVLCALVGAVAATASAGHETISARHQTKPMLTERQLSMIEEDVHNAVRLEERALALARERSSYKQVRTMIAHSMNDLISAINGLSGHDLGGVDPHPDLGGAGQWDHGVVNSKGTDWSFTVRALETALKKKRAALALLLKVPTGTATGSGLEACAFVESVAPTSFRVAVYVVWPSEGGASGMVALNGSEAPQTKTFTLGQTGTVLVAPFTFTAPGTAEVDIQASNPTTGKTGSLKLTTGWGPSSKPASTCTPTK